MNAEDNHKLSSKLGRKGDPRMHRAVAARLANPDLTLFEALRMGGFEYPTNDDASVMDAEKVTLGQRKNQLSRRLRLARKQSHKDFSHGERVPATASFADGGNSTGGNSVGGNSRTGGSSRASNSSAGGLSSEAQKELQKLMQHSRNAKMNSSTGGRRDSSGLSDDEAGDGAGMEIQEEAPKRARIAKFHPDYAPLFVPPPRNAFGSSTGGVPGASQSSNSSFQHQSQQAQQLPASIAAGMPSLSMGAAATLGAPGAGAIGGNSFGGASALFSQQAGMFQPQTGGTTGARPSAVAVASLTATAQSVGMTLEQLAVSLGSSPSNLAKILTSLNSNNTDTMTKQLNLALNLYQAESRALYSRCMLLAGIPQNQCQESSPTHLQFALNAWQIEGKRLRDLLGNSPSRGTIDVDAQFEQLTRGGVSNSSKAASRGSMDAGHGPNDSVSTTNNADRTGLESAGQSHVGDDDEDMDHIHHSHDDAEGGENEERCSRRHVHRLEGKCGHKAILHQPKDGSPHIDFVVGSHVECYQGLDAISTSSNLAWPSKFTCDDIGGCSSECGSDTIPASSKKKNVVPKTILLSQIDWSDPEWNKDVNGSIDNNLARVFKREGRSDSLAL